LRRIATTLAILIIVGGAGVAGYAATHRGDPTSPDVNAVATAMQLPPPAEEVDAATSALPDIAPSGGGTVPAAGSGRFVPAPGGSAVVGAGRLQRYNVVVEAEAGVRPEDFAAAVEATIAEPRGWTAPRRWSFQRVAAGPSDFTVHLATPATTDRICGRHGVRTLGEVSCRGGRDVVINLKRWILAVPWYADAIADYRHMVVNHEVGHFLGHGHVVCGGTGRLAPVMQRQTFGLEGCQRNPWPYPDGRTFLTGPNAPR